MSRLLLFLAVCLIGFAAALRAEPAAGEAEASNVRFKLLRPTGGSAEPWFEAEVEVQARAAPADASGLLPRVKVTLTLATEITSANTPRHLEFFRASAEAVALKTGRSSVRFYLPPEIVRRDAVRGDLRYWSVEIAVGGSAARSVPPRFSAALGGLDTRRDFSRQAASATAANDGILLPQYLTPFAADYPAATPSFVRRETGG